MELRQLRYFVTLAEELHFGRAAERLHIAQPAVSQQLSRLERELGVRLLARTPRRVSLTPEGERLLPEARAALAAAARVQEVAAGIVTGRRGELRLGTSSGLGVRLPLGVARMREHCGPGTEIVLTDGTTAAHAAGVAAGELDAAITRGAVDTARVHAERVGEDELLAVLPPDHPAAGKDAVRFDHLADLALRLPPRDRDPVSHDAVLARVAGLGFTRGRDVGSLSDAAVEIAHGGGAFTVTHPVAACAPPAGVDASAVTTAVLRPFDPPLHVPVHLLLPTDRPAVCGHALLQAFSGG